MVFQNKGWRSRLMNIWNWRNIY